MIALFDLLLWAALGLLLVPVAVLLAETSCALPPRREAPMPHALRPRLAILIPAHEEATGIGATLASVLPQMRKGDRTVVVADNCTDGTAGIARAAGAEVVERRDRARRGKGYALDAGLRHMDRDPPAVVIMIDADCRVAPGTIDRLARTVAVSGRPVQSLNLMEKPASAGTLAPIAEFAWIVKNHVRPLGLQRLGLPCPLTGTGMAFPWPVIRAARLASGHIVEDMQLGLDLARAGQPPLFCPDALVTSRFPVARADARAQRARWEHGHLGVILDVGPRLILSAIGHARPTLVAVALDLCVPPLALLALLLCGVFLAALAHALLLSSAAPLAFAAIVLLLFGGAVGLAWARFGRRVVPLRRLLLAVFYALGKVPLYLRFMVRRETQWVRSRRDEG